MRDPKWIGASPSNPYWSEDGKYLLFNWNPENAISDSVYYITLANLNPVKSSYSFRTNLLRAGSGQFNTEKSSLVYAEGGDIYLKDLKTGNRKRILQTNGSEVNPQFAFNDSKIVYTSGSNLYAWDISTGQLSQLTDFGAGAPSGSGGSRTTQAASGSRPADSRNTQDGFLKDDALENSAVLALRKSKRELADSIRKFYPLEKKLRTINIGDRSVFGLNVSPDGRFITYRLIRPATGGKTTLVPLYVTESGYTEDLGSRTKVGSPQGNQELFVFDTVADTVLAVKTDSVEG
ncbi:MAG TPA: DPP IV N-terminal domain-containing protein, partial [Chitinophagaceae bacterium]|nr:DPP IV N-terminal domain-containing protein [Chitinophagaceae bacterium]